MPSHASVSSFHTGRIFRMDFDECYIIKFEALVVGGCVKTCALSGGPRPKLVSRGNLSVHFPLRRRCAVPRALILSLFLGGGLLSCRAQ